MWNRYGFAWGGNYNAPTLPDGMHHEFMGTPAQAQAATVLARNELGGAPAPRDRPPVANAINEHYNASPALQRALGAPVTDELSCPDHVGRFRHYANNGSIYWTPATGPWAVWGRIRELWSAMGWETSLLGYPVTDESPCPDGVGRFNHFQGGSIYWTEDTGAHEVHGAIRDLWSGMGWERSALGYPVGDEFACPDGVGRFSHFQGGSIYWTPATGAHEVHGAIRETWASLGWERSPLGYPVGDEQNGPNNVGRVSAFEHGVISWTATSGAAVTVHEAPTPPPPPPAPGGGVKKQSPITGNMEIPGFDCSYTKPSAAPMVAAGYTFVIGYVSPTAGKNLHPPR
jgi:uncharacterized protein with LGFP repeats